MSLLVDVQEVPWRILEMVQARILANRQRKGRREQDEEVRGLTRPRPQRKVFGATMSTYRRPEPVGLPAEDGKGWLLMPSDLELNAKVRGIPAFRFAQGAPDTEPLIVVTSPGGDGRPYIEGAPGSVTSAASSERPLLKKPSSGAFTEECFYFISNTNDEGGFLSRLFVNFSTMYIGCQTIRNTTISRVVREVYMQDVVIGGDSDLYYASAWDDFDASFFQEAIPNESFTAYGWHHAAHVVRTVGSSVISSLYLDGSRVLLHDPQPAAAYWATFEAQNLDGITSQGFNMSAGTAAHRVSGLRYTERALYTGDTYTVPTSITRLA